MTYRRLGFALILVFGTGGCQDDAGGSDDGSDGADTDTTGGQDGGEATDGTGTSGGDATGGDTGSDGGADDGGTGTEGTDDGGSETGTEGEDDCYDDAPWTCVAVEPNGPYGERTFDVPAAQNWVNTGLYLRTGEQALIRETGSWDVGGDVGAGIDHGPCVIGDFVARIGLHYKDPELTCVSGEATIVADKDGILFVGALPSNDLGETYETRREATGAKTATVSSDGDTVPTVVATRTDSYDLDAVSSGWVELAGAHVILTVPTTTALADQDLLGGALSRLDAIYELHEELRGALPQHGQRLRFFPDGTQPGYMLAGNPIRMALSLVDPGSADRITNAGAPVEVAQVWGFAHEMGHDFTFVNGAWNYQDNSMESWCNLFSIYSLEALGIPIHENARDCEGASGSYDTWDAWGGLCFLMQFRFLYGWDFYVGFFTALNGYSASEVPGGKPPWHFVHDLFESTSGEDVTPLFDAWDVPNPG